MKITFFGNLLLGIHILNRQIYNNGLYNFEIVVINTYCVKITFLATCHRIVDERRRIEVVLSKATVVQFGGQEQDR